MPPKPRFIIIDGNAIIHRAYHALPPMTTKDGTIVNAVFGFSSMLLKVMSDLKPTHLAVSFDLSGPTFRDEIYEDYKATRQRAEQDLYDQIPLVHKIVEVFDIPMFTKEGYEADDVIGTIVQKTKDEMESIIVTGDKDMLQLVDDGKIEVYLLRKGLSDFELYDEPAVRERFGFGPKQIIDYKALMGDPSDNIPGVSGVGKKTAAVLIEQCQTVDGIYEALKAEKLDAKPGVLKKLTEQEKEARMSYELATIVTDVKGLGFQLKDAEVHSHDPEEVRSLFTQFEFFSLVKRIPGIGGEKKEKTKKKKGKRAVKCVVFDSEKGIKQVIDLIKTRKEFICREVLRGDDPLTADLHGFIFGLDREMYFLDLTKIEEALQSKLFALFKDPEYLLVGHGLKPLVKVLQQRGTQIGCQLFDTEIASYVIYGSTRRHDLSSILERDLQVLPVFAAQQESLFGVDVQPLAQDLSNLFELKALYRDELKRVEGSGVFKDIDMPLVPILARMEMAGMAVDTKLLADMSQEVTAEIAQLEKAIWKEAGEEFNVASSVQLREVLYEKMGLPTEGIKKGKTGYSTAASELEKLRGTNPIIERIEEYRELEKLRNTYIDVLPTLVHKETGRIHTSFNQTVAATGRLSSSDPNMQNIPIRTALGRKVREAFIAGKGKTLVVADYSQIELRIAAHLSGDQELIRIFKEGEDVHSATAAAINDVPLSKVTKKMRSAAKAVNFGVLFGMGAFGLASRTGISNKDAKAFIEKYYDAFSGLREYLDRTIEEAAKSGYTETIFGRRRYIPELESANYQLRAAGERMAINMPIQGTEADMIKLAMIAVEPLLPQGAQMLLQVHDELVFEVDKGQEEEVGKIVKKAMEDVVALDVPVVVEVHVSKRWGAVK